jgi:hypothetical protein
MRKIIEDILLDIDADDIIRKETYRLYTLLLVSKFRLEQNCLRQGDRHLSNHHLSNITILYRLSYITPTSICAISYTMEYRIIIANILKEVIRDGTTNIYQSYLIELFCAHAAWLQIIYITIITPIMAFIDITITILIVLVNTVTIHTK